MKYAIMCIKISEKDDKSKIFCTGRRVREIVQLRHTWLIMVPLHLSYNCKYIHCY